jgi:O-antigen ligase
METLGALVYISSLVIAFYKKDFVLPNRIILISFAGLFTVSLVSFYLNSLPLHGFFDYVGEFRWMLSYLGFLQFYQIFYKQIDFRKLFFSAQIILIIAGFYSIYQFFTAHDFFREKVMFHVIYHGSPYWRPNSFFGLPTTYAYASSMFFCVSLAFWLRERKPLGISKKITQFYFLMSGFNIFLTFTRAAWLAFLASTTTIMYLIDKKLCVRVTIVFVLFFSAFYSSMPSFQNRINSMYDPAYVANHNRIYLWKANFNIFKENPWFGIGFDENRKQIEKYLAPFNKPEVMRNHPHNTYLNFLAGLGFFGFFFFMLFVGTNLKNTIIGIRHSPHHLHKTLYIGALGLQMVLLIGGLTECNFEDIELTHQYILFTALVEYLRQQDFPS